MAKRNFSALEKNHLRKYGLENINLDSLGEKPVEYATGHAEFMGLDFLVSKDTLIPRIETEQIIQIVEDYLNQTEIIRPTIADIGTGSGCIGLTLASRLTKKQVPYSIFLSDVSQEALNIAIKNAGRVLSSPANLFFEKSDLLNNFPKIKFDIIVANLPYIPSSNIQALDSSVVDFEPLTALDGGPNGSEKINLLLKDLPGFLSKRGIAVLEINDTHHLDDFSIPENMTAQIEKDLFEHNRFLVIRPIS